MLRLQHIFAKLNSYRLNRYCDQGAGRFLIRSPKIAVNISKGKGARFQLEGVLEIRSDLGGSAPVSIILAPGSLLHLKGDFFLGPGIQIVVAPNASLIIHGRQSESASGITAESKVLVRKSISIGADFICAWQVLITDSDWHSVSSQEHTIPVSIGNHVWIAHGVSILKGSHIGDGSIIASHSLIHKVTVPPNSIFGGSPPRLLKSSVSWSRDI